MRKLFLVVVVVLSVGGCGMTGPAGGPPSTSTTSVSPSLRVDGAQLVWRLRYVLLGHYPDFAFCDPDLYPVARGDEQAAAEAWWASVDRSGPEVVTVLGQHAYREPLTVTQIFAVYRDHKKLAVIVMTQVSGGYEFELPTGVPGGEPDQSVTGLISTAGQIRERSRVARPGGCPICLPAGTRIATPGGQVPVEQIAPGDVVWTVDAAGSRVAAPVAQVVRRGTAGPHLLLRLSLTDGRVLVAAGAHPAVDGMYLRQLRRGQTYDSAMIVSVGWVPSGVPATFDILPAGPTGTYWADGIPVGSTLKPLG